MPQNVNALIMALTPPPPAHASRTFARAVGKSNAAALQDSGEINLTSRRKFCVPAATRLPNRQTTKMMQQQVSDKCQIIKSGQQQECCRCKRLPLFSSIATAGSDHHGGLAAVCHCSSYHQVHETTNFRLEQSTLAVSNNTQRLKEQSMSNSVNRSRTNTNLINDGRENSTVPKQNKKIRGCTTSQMKPRKYLNPEPINNNNTMAVLLFNMINSGMQTLWHREYKSAAKSVASPPESDGKPTRIRRRRNHVTTVAATTAKTTAWVNTLLTAWLLMQELYSVFPTCDARSTTVINAGNPDAKRLYDDLLSNYNKLVRPVVNTTDALQVMIKLKLSQLIDVVSNGRFSVFVTFNYIPYPILYTSIKYTKHFYKVIIYM